MTSNFPTPDDVTTVVRTAGTYARDLAERVVFTFLATAAGLFVAAEPADMFEVGFWQGVGTASFAAVVSLVKGLIARFRGDRNSASLAPRV
ncbi:hypothetical protein RM780_04065 [Streptomyces sp. DSM 44917]|uniref:Holin n=1 Tax=Streptomyces boetiae TaxID=3075541 RepID=A0ABU2L3K7_9ACTN|nr:hypothetical protein [Streptomyces sp. DSM 44917]MDT0306138.1 hypothetical protein [Streptomyces sp. DSM 44917]